MPDALSLQMLYRVSYLLVTLARMREDGHGARRAEARRRLGSWVTGPRASALDGILERGERMLVTQESGAGARRAAYRHAFMLCTALRARQRQRFIADLEAVAAIGDPAGELELGFIAMIQRVFGLGVVDESELERDRADVA